MSGLYCNSCQRPAVVSVGTRMVAGVETYGWVDPYVGSPASFCEFHRQGAEDWFAEDMEMADLRSKKASAIEWGEW